jgi:hypothetical protein
MARALAAGQVTFTDISDRAAAERLSALFAAGRDGLHDLERHARRPLRRLYRVRNLVLHGGTTGSLTLFAALRTAAPLVGAGIDRVTRGAILLGLRPVELAARARIRIEIASQIEPADYADLLELAD